MKKQKLWYLLALSMVLPTFSLQAQLSDHLLPHMGFMRETISLAPESSTIPINYDALPYNALHIGTYYAIGHINDVFSYGVDGSLQFGVFPQVINGELKLDGIVQTPVYAMVRLGANSTPYNTQRLGIAAGIGGVYSFMSFRTSATQKLRADFFIPDAVFEVTFMSGGNPLTGRLHIGLNDAVFNRQIVNEAGDVLADDPFFFRGLGWGLIYGF
ncbi:MAG: hypothetical protein AAF927_29545 [Bacteroidota bacterium]